MVHTVDMRRVLKFVGMTFEVIYLGTAALALLVGVPLAIVMVIIN